MTDPLSILRELVALKRLHDKIEAAEAKGSDNFVDGKPLPFAKDDYEIRKAAAWAKAFAIADASRADLPQGSGTALDDLTT